MGIKSPLFLRKSTESDIWDPKSAQGFGLEKLDVKALTKGKDKVKFCCENKSI